MCLRGKREAEANHSARPIGSDPVSIWTSICCVDSELKKPSRITCSPSRLQWLHRPGTRGATGIKKAYEPCCGTIGSLNTKYVVPAFVRGCAPPISVSQLATTMAQQANISKIVHT